MLSGSEKRVDGGLMENNMASTCFLKGIFKEELLNVVGRDAN